MEQKMVDGWCTICGRTNFIEHADNSDKLICCRCQSGTTKEMMESRRKEMESKLNKSIYL